MVTQTETAVLRPLARYEQSVVDRIADFNDPRQEWRRLFAELFGTFLLVLVAAGGGMMGHAFPGVISRTAAVTAPALMVMGIILFMGKISGAHLNPAVSIAFALRRDFPWIRVPGYVLVQLIGATLAALVLRSIINVSAMYGSNYPPPRPRRTNARRTAPIRVGCGTRRPLHRNL
jgi:aquaporin Z